MSRRFKLGSMVRTKFSIFYWPLCAVGFHLGCIQLKYQLLFFFFFFDLVVHHNNVPFLSKILLAFNIKKSEKERKKRMKNLN